MSDQGPEDQVGSLVVAFGRAEGGELIRPRTRLALVRAEATVVPFPGTGVRIVACPEPSVPALPGV